MSKKPPVIVLCGGLGTRLRDVVADQPKVLAPIAGQPYLHYLLTHLANQGYRDITLSTGYRADQVRAYAGEGTRWGIGLRYAEEPKPLGTGGALRYTMAQQKLETPFLALNGDTFFTGQLDDLVDFHNRHPKAIASLALIRVPNAARYGTVAVEAETGAVTAFREKDAAHTHPAWVNAGVYFLQPALLAHWAVGVAFSLEKEVFAQHVGNGLYARPYPEAHFLDIGTPADFARAAAFVRQLGLAE